MAGNGVDDIGDREGGFVSVARVDDVGPAQARQVTVQGRWVALFNVDGAYHAIDATCLHRGGPLAEGAMNRCIVTCPWHGWQFDVTTGVLVQDPTVGVTLHQTRIVGDEIQVRLTPDGVARR
jgi:nitrite reductase (NADH) small subunit